MKYKAKANIIALGLHVRRDEVITEEQYKKVPEDLQNSFEPIEEEPKKQEVKKTQTKKSE